MNELAMRDIRDLDEDMEKCAGPGQDYGTEYCQEAITNDEGDELVPKGFACLICGERRMDRLAWNKTISDRIDCYTCGARYEA